jgi:predicted DCC family thiol-disulfide oxidoreductase YuxK
VNTEITEHIKEWLFYDADCALCRGWVARLARRLRGQGIGAVPLQSQEARERLGHAANPPWNEMKCLTTDGCILGGADALVYLVDRCFWWGWGLRVIAQLPGAKFVLRRAYAWLARHRHCVKGGCEL